jgi:hypothetical protein
MEITTKNQFKREKRKRRIKNKWISINNSMNEKKIEMNYLENKVKQVSCDSKKKEQIII